MNFNNKWDIPNRREIENYLMFFKNNAYAQSYIKVHLERYYETLNVFHSQLPGEGKLLELGAYVFLPLLLQKLFKYELYLNCLFDDTFERIREEKIFDERSKETHIFKFYNFNAEKDTFPFENEFFDVVVAFELIEHFMFDPMFMIGESNRVLKKNSGKLFITTPNAISLRSLHSLINGKSPLIHSKFSRPIGTHRHFREFTPEELEVMLESGGFEVEYLQTKNVWSKTPEGFDYAEIYPYYEELLKKYDEMRCPCRTHVPSNMRGEDIFIIGRKVSEVKNRFPELLYE